MLVGSHASSYYGEPRSTHDVDLVVDLPRNRIRDLLDSFGPPQYYLSEAALREGRMANLLDIENGDKADLFLLGTSVDERREFSRRRTVVLDGEKVELASVEDTIVAKLRWYVESGSDRQLLDVRMMWKAQESHIDRNYLQARISDLDLESTWRQAIEGDSE